MIARNVLVPVLVIVAACGSKPAEKGTAAQCFAYVAPKGWAVVPSKAKADIVVMNPEKFEVTPSKMMQDSFTVTFGPIPGSLDDFKDQLLGALTQSNVDKAVREAAIANPAVGSNLTSGVPKPVVTPTTLAGRDAFRVDVRNPMRLGDTPIVIVESTTFAKFGDEIVIVTTGSVESRAAEVAPLAAAFLASITFDRCK